MRELPRGARGQVWGLALFGGLELHVLVDRKLRRCAADVVTGTGRHHMKATGTDREVVGIRRTLAGNGDVVSRDHFVEGYIFSFAGEIPALGLGDADEVALHAGNVDGSLRVGCPGDRRRALSLLGIDVHAYAQHDDDAEKAKNASHGSLPNANCIAKGSR